MGYLDKKLERLGYTMQKHGEFTVSYINPKPENLYFGHAKQIEIEYAVDGGKEKLLLSCHSVNSKESIRAWRYGYPMALNFKELAIIFLKCLWLNVYWKFKLKRRKHD